MLALLLILQAVQPVVGKAERPIPAPWVELKADAILTVLTAPDKSQWLLIDDGADLVPSADGKTATFAAISKGRYRVVVVSTTGESARIVVVVGDAPAPPTPTPPGPTPPPTPPVPADPLTVKLQLAFKLDLRPDPAAKAKDLGDLVALYIAAAELTGKADIGTVGELVAKVHEAAKSLTGTGLLDCRKCIAEELKLAFPVDAAMDDASRAKAKGLFLKISKCLGEVK